MHTGYKSAVVVNAPVRLTWIMDLIRDAHAEQAATPMTEDDMLKESAELAQYGAAQATKRGVKPRDVTRIIDASRAGDIVVARAAALNADV